MTRLSTVAKSLLTMFLLCVSFSAFAELTPIWENAVTDNQSVTDFDIGELQFDPIEGNCVEIVNEDDGYYHDHGNGENAFFMQVRVDGNWTTVHVQSTRGNGDDYDLADIPSARFNSGEVDGVIIRSESYVGNFFHSVSPEMQFEIGTRDRCGPPPIPTLSSWMMIVLAAMIGSVGLFVMRRRREFRV